MDIGRFTLINFLADVSLMLWHRVASILVLVCCLVVMSLSAQSQSPKQEKIHPLLHAAINAYLSDSKGFATRTLRDLQFQQILDASVQTRFSERLFEEKANSYPKHIIAFGEDEKVDVVVYFNETLISESLLRSEMSKRGVWVNSVVGQFFTARLRLQDIETLSEAEYITYFDLPEQHALHRMPFDDLSVPETGASYLQEIGIGDSRFTGRNVIILVIDTGIDFRHLDFRNPANINQSRVLAIWDQTLTAISGESPPQGFDYGVEYTQSDLNGAIANTRTVRTQDTDGHGTHVTGSAAGNGLSFGVTKGNEAIRRFIGMAPEADIVAINAFSGPTTTSTRLIDGLRYARLISERFNRPVVVNMSLGSVLGSKDGRDPVSASVNAFSRSGPGRVVAISAGNSGNDSLHVGRTLTAGTTEIIKMTVIPSSLGGPHTGALSFDLWTSNSQNFTATLRLPSGVEVSIPNGINGAPSVEVPDGALTVFNNISPSNNQRNVYFSIDAPTVGDYELRFTAPVDMRYDGYRAFSGTVRARVLNGDVTQTIAGGQATSEEGIAVGSYQTRWVWPSVDGSNYAIAGSSDRRGNISVFSSLGPTRTGGQKPDIAAPGEMIISALSSAVQAPTSQVIDGRRHRVLRGTSMSCPHVAGGVALILQASPSLMAWQVKSLLVQSANTDTFTGTIFNTTWGRGKMDIAEAVAKARNPEASLNRYILSYTSAVTQPTVQFSFLTASASSASQKYALRFSPTQSGRLTGFTMDIERLVGSMTSTLSAALYKSSGSGAGSRPNEQIGERISVPFIMLSRRTRQFVSLSQTPALVDSLSEYFLVLETSAPNQDSLTLGGDNGPSAFRSYLSRDRVEWANFRDASSQLSLPFSESNLFIRPHIVTASNLFNLDTGGTANRPFVMMQNYPNPFQRQTSIPVRMNTSGLLEIELFDILGRKLGTVVRRIVDTTPLQFVVDSQRFGLSSGVYFYRARSQGHTETKKMVLIR